MNGQWNFFENMRCLIYAVQNMSGPSLDTMTIIKGIDPWMVPLNVEEMKNENKI